MRSIKNEYIDEDLYAKYAYIDKQTNTVILDAVFDDGEKIYLKHDSQSDYFKYTYSDGAIIELNGNGYIFKTYYNGIYAGIMTYEELEWHEMEEIIDMLYELDNVTAASFEAIELYNYEDDIDFEFSGEDSSINDISDSYC